MKVSKYFIGDSNDSPHNTKQHDEAEVWIVAEKSESLEQYSAFIEKIFAKTPWKDCSKTFKSADSVIIDAQQNDSLLIVFFGLRPQDCQLQCTYRAYHPLFISGHTLLFASAMDEVHGSVDHKKQLWSALQLIMNRLNH